MSPTDRNLPEDDATGKVPDSPLTDQTRNRRLVKKEPLDAAGLSPQQRLLLLDTWRRSGLPARGFGVLVGVSRHTLALLDQTRNRGLVTAVWSRCVSR